MFLNLPVWIWISLLFVLMYSLVNTLSLRDKGLMLFLIFSPRFYFLGLAIYSFAFTLVNFSFYLSRNEWFLLYVILGVVVFIPSLIIFGILNKFTPINENLKNVKFYLVLFLLSSIGLLFVLSVSPELNWW